MPEMFMSERLIREKWGIRRPEGSGNGSVTLVLLPLKYEIDDSVTVTVVLLGEAGRCTLMGWT